MDPFLQRLSTSVFPRSPYTQCYGSGSVSDPDSIGSVDPDPDPGARKVEKIRNLNKNLHTGIVKM